MKTQHIRHLQVIFVSMLCIAVGAVAGGAYERSNRLSKCDEVLGLLVHSCINEKSYDKLLRRLDVDPLQMIGSSGTDFDNIHGDGKGQLFVVTLNTDEVSKDQFYQLEYEVVEGVNGSRLAGFRVFCLHRRDNSTKCVIEARRRVDLE